MPSCRPATLSARRDWSGPHHGLGSRRELHPAPTHPPTALVRAPCDHRGLPRPPAGPPGLHSAVASAARAAGEPWPCPREPSPMSGGPPTPTTAAHCPKAHQGLPQPLSHFLVPQDPLYGSWQRGVDWFAAAIRMPAEKRYNSVLFGGTAPSPTLGSLSPLSCCWALSAPFPCAVSAPGGAHPASPDP